MSKRTRSKEYKQRKTCKKKKSFTTHLGAYSEAMYLYKNNGFINTPYQCTVCGYWHNTTKFTWCHNTKVIFFQDIEKAHLKRMT